MIDKLRKWIDDERNELKERKAKTDHKGELNYIDGRLDQLLILEIEFLNKL